MNTQDKTFLKEATKAFEAEKEAADAALNHTCVVCCNRVLQVFLRCRTMEGLVFDHAVAKEDADEYRIGLDYRVFSERLTWKPESPSIDWLESLYKL